MFSVALLLVGRVDLMIGTLRLFFVFFYRPAPVVLHFFEIVCLNDVDSSDLSVGLPVGLHVGSHSP